MNTLIHSHMVEGSTLIIEGEHLDP